MLVELTYKCTMGCNHCMSDCNPDGKNMSKDTLIDVLDFLNKNNIEVWNFSGGEMFEHPDILEILDIIEDKWNKSYPIVFITNGRRLVDNRDIYDRVSQFKKKYKSMVFIQVTDDDRFYPTKLTEKQKYYLRKLDAIIDNVPGDDQKCLYPQGRALENFSEEWWNTIGPKCGNVRALTLQGVTTIYGIVKNLMSVGKLCTPVIAPDGSIKLGESALCPSVASIYDEEDKIIKMIKECKCVQCNYAWNRFRETNPAAYELLTEEW